MGLGVVYPFLLIAFSKAWDKPRLVNDIDCFYEANTIHLGYSFNFWQRYFIYLNYVEGLSFSICSLVSCLLPHTFLYALLKTLNNVSFLIIISLLSEP